MPAMRAVGDRQAWDHLEGRLSAEQLREQGIAATRQLAKRQLTWLRSMPYRQRVSCDRVDRVAQVLQLAQAVWGPSA